MTTEVNKVISELYGALVGFPSNEEDNIKMVTLPKPPKASMTYSCDEFFNFY